MKQFHHYPKLEQKLVDVKADGTYCIESIVLKVSRKKRNTN
jgi:hypothetical protein